jgi:bud site selection protein 31
MSFRRRLKNKRIPEGFDKISEVIEDFEQQLKEAVVEEHEGKRKNESNWKIHRLHWEKNRFIYDLMYVRKVMSKELYDFLVREKIADGALISKWRKPGYEILCSMLAIQKGNHNFGTTSHCRVPMRMRAPQQRVTPDVQTGCICCASGDGRFGGPIWWNTPMDDTTEAAEQNRAVWTEEQDAGQDDEERNDGPEAEEGGEGEGAPQAKRHRALNPEQSYEPNPNGEDDNEDELDDEVKARLAALRGDG